MTTPVWLPDAIKRPIPPGANDPPITPVGAVFHVAVSEGSSLYDYFRNRSGGIESHGYIRRDGTVEQYRAVNYECDAQVAGNSWVSGGRRYGLTSWESQGMGEGEWTRAQLDTIRRIIMWHHTTRGIPLRLCPGPNSPGFGYHRLFAAWNPNGHSCPGPDRVLQFQGGIVPWMRAGGDGAPTDWMDMATEAEVKALLDKALAAAVPKIVEGILSDDSITIPDNETDSYKHAAGPTASLRGAVKRLMYRAAKGNQDTGTLAQQVDEIHAAVVKSSPLPRS